MSNAGPDAATGVVVTDTLPAGLTYLSDNCGGTFVAPTFTWNVGNLVVAGQVSCQLTVQVDANAPDGPIVNIATVAGNETDPTPGNAASAFTVTVSQFGELEIPTLSTVGMFALLLLLAGSAVVILRRRG